jgi:hypothetical protein
VVGSDGLFVVTALRYIPYAAIVATRSEYEDKRDFREIELELDDGSKVSLKVEADMANCAMPTLSRRSWGIYFDV